MGPLQGKVALVAGATRGAGRGIARMLGEAGATVYCTGRGTRERPSSVGHFAGRPETIDETAEMVDAAGGRGIAVRVDHHVTAEVEELIGRIRKEQGRLDVLVNALWGGPAVEQYGKFWTHSVDEGRALFDAAWPHILTCRCAAPLMVERKAGLMVLLSEGDSLKLEYRGNVFYDLARTAELRLAFGLAHELEAHGVTALAVTPGFMRTESILKGYGVTEANWRHALEKDDTKEDATMYGFAASESPCFVGRAIAALAADAKVADKSGGLYSSWGLSEEYGFADIDGARPHWGREGAKFVAEFPYEKIFGSKKPAEKWRWVMERVGKAG